MICVMYLPLLSKLTPYIKWAAYGMYVTFRSRHMAGNLVSISWDALFRSWSSGLASSDSRKLLVLRLHARSSFQCSAFSDCSYGFYLGALNWGTPPNRRKFPQKVLSRSISLTRSSATAERQRVFLGSLTDRALHWTPHVVQLCLYSRHYQLTNRATYAP